jgi:uncharacterized protein with GYD domain
MVMATFFMFGRYSAEAILIKKFKGEVQGMYSLLGEKDLVFILTFPGIEQAMKASVALSKMTGISFTTVPAVTVEEFDKMMTEV